jgi:hypothetical protein
MCHSYIPQKMKWLLKSQFDQNSIVIDHKLNDNFKSHLIFGMTQEKLLVLLVQCSSQGSKNLSSQRN